MLAQNITMEMVESYAEACIALNENIENLYAAGYKLLVIPSRGASPFISGAVSYAHQYHAEKKEEFQPLIKPINRIRDLYLPFTADVSDDFPIGSRSIRKFWSRVLAAIVTGKVDDIALRFYDRFFNQQGNLIRFSGKGEAVRNDKFIFIDTVVSGRAICEIFDAFEFYGLKQCHFLLLIDQEGGSLRPEHRDKIDARVASGDATRINVQEIFTEDEGPAVSGIWSVTVPTFMTVARKMIEDFANEDITGAGLYYHEVSKREDESNIAITVSNAILGTLLYSAVTARSTSEYFLEEYRSHISNNHLQDQAITQRIAEPVLHTKLPYLTDIDVSGSHVLRASMSEKVAEKMVQEFLSQT